MIDTILSSLNYGVPLGIGMYAVYFLWCVLP